MGLHKLTIFLNALPGKSETGRIGIGTDNTVGNQTDTCGICQE